MSPPLAGPASPTATPTPLPTRIGFAAVAVMIAGLAWLISTLSPGQHTDFDQHWLAIRALAAGLNPYDAIGPGREYGFPFAYYYPLPAALLASPLALLPLIAARMVFILGSAALLAWVAVRYDDVRMPMFFSGAFFHACLLGQWPPLLMVAFLVPSLGFLAVAKPHTGLALFAGSLDRHYLASMTIGALALGLAAAVVLPSWHVDWLTNVRSSPGGSFSPPLMVFGGPLILLALFRWREAEARLLVALACFPQTGLLYDALPLFLVCRSKREGWVLCGLSLLAYAVQTYIAGTPSTEMDPMRALGEFRGAVLPWVVWLMYLPATAIVLWRPHSTS